MAADRDRIGPDAAIWSARRRMLALDGGGTRGIVAIAFLERIEALLRVRSGRDAAFRLSDHFDLIGGTSTGAIIAAGLALGRSVEQIKQVYFELGPAVFRKRWHIPLFQARYGSAQLGAILTREFGGITLEDPALRTLLAVVTKRVDTGSPWIVSNLTTQPYWNDRPDGARQGNRHIGLASLVRASAAAPFYFGPERIPISADVTGTFVDGAVSPYNSPTIPLLLLATASRYGLNWPVGVEELSIVSVGTGRSRPPPPSAWTPSAKLAVDGLRGVIEDTMSTSLMLMQWLGATQLPEHLNRDVGTLAGEPLGGRELFAFQRFDVRLEESWLETYFGLPFEAREIIRLRQIDDAGAMGALYDLAREVAERMIRVDGE
ncbi:MAG: patatin-like phospholipase family protein [Devosia sp.]|uniref:patatin-like phospholipase family protein n=1 Tax=Devosia sp. TaxID=1871048 RepID=UPI001A5FADFE|nr:patatin-like phospholipase family protein [Devosia sp.]MBL8597220.1 patatin-like phospholipase family protein [Devosia sp.]